MRTPMTAVSFTRPIRTLRSAHSPVLVLVLVGMFLVVLPGCKKNGPSGSAEANRPTAAELQKMSAVDLYNARYFREAKDKAESAISTANGRDREVLQLTAGLSCHALKQPALAQHHLEGLTGSADPQIAGRAEATLGQIAQQRGNHKYAADLFNRASKKLEGDDSARAAMRAGESLSIMGNQNAATQQYRAAAENADTARLKQHADRLSKQGPFTIQAGAYSTRANADKRAAELAALAQRAGLTRPVVLADTINGRPGYSVRIGAFTSKGEANTARAKLGSGQFVVVAANE